MTTRRVLILQSVIGTSALASGVAMAAAPMADEADAMSKTLEYSADSAKSKSAKHVKGSTCANCGLFQGKAGDAAGGCPLFAGKQVAGAGWCNAWVKKA